MKTKRVSVYKYKGLFFSKKAELVEYKTQEKRRKKAVEVEDDVYSEYDNDPSNFTLPEPYKYFDFLIDYDTPKERYRCFRAKKITTAIKQLLKLSFNSLDYESQLLDKGKKGTGVYIDLYKLPKELGIYKFLN